MAEDSEKTTDATADSEQTTTANTEGKVGRRRVLSTLGTGFLASSMAGCSGDGGDGGGGGDGGDGGGGGDGGDGGSTDQGKDPIKLGYMVATDYQLGNSSWRGAKIAIDEINSNGGLLGRQIEPTIKNTEADPQTGQSVYQELTVGEDVDVTMGTWSSEVLIATLNGIRNQADTLHITAGASTAQAPKQLKEDYENLKYWFRAGPINAIYVGRMYENFAGQLYPSNDLNKIAILGENYAWADSSWDSILRNVPKSGVEIVQKTRYAADTEDFTTLFDKVESNGADAVLALAAYTSTPLVNQWANQERPFGMTGVVNSLQPSTAYNDLNGTPQFAVPWVVATPHSNNTSKTGPFAEEYISRHNMSPLYSGYCGYDAVQSYAKAVEEAGTTDSDKLVETMEGMRVTGTQGNIQFAGKDAEFPHDVIYNQSDMPQVHIQWQEESGEGEQVAVYPSDYATGEYKHPDWI